MNILTHIIFLSRRKEEGGKGVANTAGLLQEQKKAMFFVAIAAQGKPFDGSVQKDLTFTQCF